MLIPHGDGTYIGGPLDVIMIYHNVAKGTFHPVFYEEKSMPGPIRDYNEIDAVRLKSNMHHTEGFKTFEEAQANVRDVFSKQIVLPPSNVAIERAVNWDGQNGDVWIVQNWRKEGAERPFAEVNFSTV